MDKRLALFAVALLSARVWAEDLPELQETVVTATREPTDPLQSPSFVTIITQKDIEESGAADLSTVLAQQSGVVVNDYGPEGSTKTVSIRGSTSDQVLVMVDGIRFNSSFDGSVDLSRIPVDDIDHIEIVQGGASSYWGTGAVGGVINIITKKASAPAINISITNGSYIPHDGYAVTETGSSFVSASPLSLLDNQKLALSLSDKIGDVGLTGGGSLIRAMNAFLWDDTVSLNDWRVRNNAQDLAQDAYAGIDVPLLGGSYSMRGSFDHSLIGVPGSVTFVSSQASQEDTSAMGSFAYGTDSLFTSPLSLDLKGSYRWARETYDNPLYPPESQHTTNAANLDLTQRLSVSDAVSAVYGGNASYEVVDSTNIVGRNDRITLAGFVSLPFSPMSSLTINPSLRYDYYSDFPGYLSYQLAAVLLLSNMTSLKASFSSAYLAPTLSDLYWYSYDGSDQYGDTYYSYGNPNLQPETSYSGEIGVAFAGKWISLETSVFTRLVFNQIDWSPYTASPSQPTVFIETPVNISESFLPGAEIHATATITDQISLEANYTFIYSLLLQYLGQNYTLSDNIRVPFVPIHDLSLIGKYRTGIHSFNVELQYVSEKFIDAANTASTALAGYVVVNAGYRMAVSGDMVFSVALRNMLNTLYYTESGYPMPPFSIVTGMEVKL